MSIPFAILAVVNCKVYHEVVVGKLKVLTNVLESHPGFL